MGLAVRLLLSIYFGQIICGFVPFRRVSLTEQHRRTGQKKLGGRTHFCPTHPKVSRRVKNESKYRLIVA